MQSKYPNPFEEGTREYELFEYGLADGIMFFEEIETLTPRHFAAYMKGCFTPTFQERLQQDEERMKACQAMWVSNSTAPTPNTMTPPPASTSMKTEATASDVDTNSRIPTFLPSSVPYPFQQEQPSLEPGVVNDFISHKKLA
jgi:hypothetical protein